MKKVFVFAIAIISLIGLTVKAEEVVKIDKPWSVAIGPVVSGSLPANQNANGTKFAFHAAYEMGISEYMSWDIYYDSNFNTASMGMSQVATSGAGMTYFFKDRSHDTSSYIGLDAGYGGANKNMEADISGAITLGIRFFRTKEFSFDINYRRMAVFTTAVNKTVLPNNPEFNQFYFGINF